jgi:UDPglucose--hexose-1-phosphate uridylyltransferase
VSELRHEPIYGRDVIIAPGRLQRPNALSLAPWRVENSKADCPFCRGQEHRTPRAVLQLPAATDAPWQVRVVPNQYPAANHGLPAELGDDRHRLAARGRHEVVVESPDHVAGLLDLDAAQQRLVMEAYRLRLSALEQESGIRCGLVFKNHGPGAGASQPHVHSQILGLATLPRAIELAYQNAVSYRQKHDRCIFCDFVADELRGATRIVDTTPDFVALCPFASRTAYEVWILPRDHASRFQDIGGRLLDRFACFVSSVLARLENSVQYVTYNFAIHTAPFDKDEFDGDHDHPFHWHMIVTPRLASIAGFEMATDTFINPVSPKCAAKKLQAAATVRQSTPAESGKTS